MARGRKGSRAEARPFLPVKPAGLGAKLPRAHPGGGPGNGDSPPSLPALPEPSSAGTPDLA